MEISKILRSSNEYLLLLAHYFDVQ